MTGLLPKILILAITISYQIGCCQSSITNYTKDNGLTSNLITCYLVDSKGTVWLGTAKGINVYTGSGWTSITSIENKATGKKEAIDQVRTIFEDSKGYIWVGSENGIFCYLGNYWINFLNKTDDEGYVPVRFYEDGHGRVLALMESRKDLREGIGLVVLSGSVQIFDENKNFSFVEHVTGSFFDKYLDNDFHFFNNILVDHSGYLWLSSNDGLYRTKGDEWDKYEKEELKCKRTFDIAEDNTGNIWVGTDNGVAEFQNGKWIKFDKKEGLKNTAIQKLAVDPEGRIWANNENELKTSGLNMYTGSKWIFYSSKNLHIKGTIRDVFFADGEVLVWTNKGVSHFENGKWKAYEKNSGLKDKKYNRMVKDYQGKIWLAGDRCLYVKKGDHWEVAFQAGEELDAMVLFFGRNNLCWVGTEKDGVYHQTAKNGWTHLNEEKGLVDDNIKSIFEDKSGNTWIVSKRGVSIVAE